MFSLLINSFKQSTFLGQNLTPHGLVLGLIPTKRCQSGSSHKNLNPEFLLYRLDIQDLHNIGKNPNI
jgi:hypothetical protein